MRHLVTLLLLLCSFVFALPSSLTNRVTLDEKVRSYVSPVKIVWRTPDSESSQIVNAEYLLNRDFNGVVFRQEVGATFVTNGSSASILLDFGLELVGGLQIAVADQSPKEQILTRIRFGESAMEAMAELGEKQAFNNAANRDIVYNLTGLGTNELGNTGFRFVRIDVLSPNAKLMIQAIRAVFTFRDLEYKGSFQSSDEKLNQVWNVGAYTVQLTMQDFQWDAIKRDRLVWIGDLHVEANTAIAAFGDISVIKKSSDQIRDFTVPPSKWMNTISSYSLAWIRIQYDLFMWSGDFDYLRENENYLVELLDSFQQLIGADGAEKLDGWRFLDWPNSKDHDAVHAGLHSMMILAFERGSKLMGYLNRFEEQQRLLKSIRLLRRHIPINPKSSKQAGALMSLAGLADPKEINDKVLNANGTHGMSTYLGYHVLMAKSAADDVQGGIQLIKDFWGRMLDFGATTFWEEFDVDWTVNASPIDQITPAGMIDIHGDTGEYCYKGFTKSLCHGWSTGPTAWLSQAVLGVNILEPGCKVVRIEPNLGDLDYVTGSFPTPYGNIVLHHFKSADGEVKTNFVHIPQEIQVENMNMK